MCAKKGPHCHKKASGLALGKGVYVCGTNAEAEEALKEIMINRAHKDAGDEVVTEEFLDGEEVSIHALCDGKEYLMFPPAQDHKRIGEGDTGKNTGGMGVIAPVLKIGGEMQNEIRTKVIRPILSALEKRGAPFSGLLYPGLKITSRARKFWNSTRFGDPECQVYMRLMNTGLLELLEACADGNLAGKYLEWNPGFAVNIVLASGGYPDAYKRDFR